MEIKLSRIQASKIIQSLDSISQMQAKVEAYEKEAQVIKTLLAEREKNKVDIIETILDCHQVDVSKVRDLQLVNGALVFNIVEEVPVETV